ncbi:MAG: amidohydrolase [Polyangia bacterium]
MLARSRRLQRTLLFLSLGALGLLAAPAADAAPKAAAARRPAAADGSDEARAPAELVVLGAQVVTMDAARPQASAVALRERRVVYVGDDAGAAALIGPHTRVVRGASAEPATSPSGPGPQREPLAGPQPITVLPGLIDAHAHLVGLGLSLRALDLRGLSSPSTIAQAVRLRVRELEKAAGSSGATVGSRDQWVRGRGWDQNRFTPAQLPGPAERRLLDEAAGEHPVLLRRIDGHAAWVNSEALRRAGIDERTPDPAGGRIERTPSGQPTGVLVDNAMALVEKLLPPPSPEELREAILAASRHVAARGLTAVHEMGIGPRETAVYRQLDEDNLLPVRVFAFAEDPMPTQLAQFPHSLSYKAELDRLRDRLGPPESGSHFSLRGIKLYLDGALGSRGAALLAPYSDEPGHSGLLLVSPDHIEAMARWGALHGYQIATHAIGDRANTLVLDAYERAGVTASRNLRFRVEHAQVLNPDDLARRRYQKLGVLASVQPTHATSDMPWAEARLGKERLAYAYATRKLLSSGARICAGSDFPVEEADPRLGLHAAVLRQDPLGQPQGGFLPSEKLTLGEAIRAFTSDAAYASFAENQLGRIEVGRAADLTVLGGKLDLEPGAPPPRDLPQRPVLLTIVDGVVVHDGLTLGKAGPNVARPEGGRRAGRRPVGLAIARERTRRASPPASR